MSRIHRQITTLATVTDEEHRRAFYRLTGKAGGLLIQFYFFQPVAHYNIGYPALILCEL